MRARRSAGSDSLAVAISILVLGWLLVVGGAFAMVGAFRTGSIAGTIMMLILALMLLGTGGWLIVNPVAGLVGLTMLIACYLLLAGFARMLLAVFNRTHGWVWRLAGGAVRMLLGVLIFIGWPVTGFVAIGLFLGLDLLVTGILWIADAIWPSDAIA
jgi:uncharacterized membrane protein HdeD (DUF308 family)